MPSGCCVAHSEKRVCCTFSLFSSVPRKPDLLLAAACVLVLKHLVSSLPTPGTFSGFKRQPASQPTIHPRQADTVASVPLTGQAVGECDASLLSLLHLPLPFRLLSFNHRSNYSLLSFLYPQSLSHNTYSYWSSTKLFAPPYFLPCSCQSASRSLIFPSGPFRLCTPILPLAHNFCKHFPFSSFSILFSLSLLF